MKNFLMFTFIIGLLALTGCADQVDYNVIELSAHTYGFWGGLWHGMVLPFSWIGSMFSDNISIYAVSNNGGWYDFGFILGAGALIRTSI